MSLPHLYTVKDGAVLWNGKPTKADVASFTPLGGAWARDASHIFVQGAPRRGIDLATFQYLNPVFVKDACAVYDWEGTIKGANPATFVILDPGVFIQDEIVPQAWARGYARDADAVYYHDQMFGRATALRGADPGSFVSLRNDYGLDVQGVWHQKSRLPKAAPATWVYLGRLWSRDQTRVFYAEREVTGLDRERFAPVLAPTIGNFATDGKRFFNADREIPEEEFWAELAENFGAFEQRLRVARRRFIR